MQRNSKAVAGLGACLRIAAALSVLAAFSNPSVAQQQGTAEEREACTPDAFRLCGAFIPDADKITACLKSNRSQLSPACKVVFSGKPRPSANESTYAQGRRGSLR